MSFIKRIGIDALCILGLLKGLSLIQVLSEDGYSITKVIAVILLCVYTMEEYEIKEIARVVSIAVFFIASIMTYQVYGVRELFTKYSEGILECLHYTGVYLCAVVGIAVVYRWCPEFWDCVHVSKGKKKQAYLNRFPDVYFWYREVLK